MKGGGGSIAIVDAKRCTSPHLLTKISSLLHPIFSSLPRSAHRRWMEKKKGEDIQFENGFSILFAAKLISPFVCRLPSPPWPRVAVAPLEEVAALSSNTTRKRRRGEEARTNSRAICEGASRRRRALVAGQVKGKSN